MASRPWKTTDDLLASVKQKILMPAFQSTFSNQSIIDFLNDEMKSSQIPSVMSLHESFFVSSVEVPLETGKVRYQIPNRAIGMKLNDLHWKDENNNLNEMTRINDGDKSYYQCNIGFGSVNFIKFYLEGNYVVFTSNSENFTPTGSLVFSIFLRPNELVTNDRAATIQSFYKAVTVVNADLIAGDTITVLGQVFTANTDFTIGGSSIITATNLATAINTNGIAVATNGSPSTAIVNIILDNISDIRNEITSSSDGLVLSDNVGMNVDTTPANVASASLVDFLQTNPGHQIYDFDISPVSITGTMLEFANDDVPDDLIVGDYICEAHECIIPGIPPDLHNLLAERAAAEILKSIGDQQGLQASDMRIQQKEKSQGTLIDNRVENAPQKINGSAHSILRYTSRRGRW